MQIKMVLFDLDGTLLPMDQDKFVEVYFGLLAQKLAPHGYEPKKLIGAIGAGIGAMVKNDGSRTNEEAFWDAFCEIFGDKARDDLPIFEAFYQNDFVGAKSVCGFDSQAVQTVRAIKERGFRVALATNPLFPAAATQQRIRWAGLEPSEFELVTTYEDSRTCKPNPDYYREVAVRLGVQPEECLMVGNDVGEDMIARSIGMQVFLLPACLINKGNADLAQFPHGGFDDLLRFIDGL
jgi:FMN phosphatase YigB (HAD superfamily)